MSLWKEMLASSCSKVSVFQIIFQLVLEINSAIQFPLEPGKTQKPLGKGEFMRAPFRTADILYIYLRVTDSQSWEAFLSEKVVIMLTDNINIPFRRCNKK